MRFPHLILALVGLSLNAYADSVGVITPAPAPGSLVVVTTSLGTVSELVLATDGPRTLVLRAGVASWETAVTLNNARIYAPIANPYVSVLAPVYAEGGQVILGFDVVAATSVVKDVAGRTMIIGGNGRGYAIDLPAENIPVKSGQSIPEAIRGFNIRAHEVGHDRVMNENARLDRSREFETINLARARAEADHGAAADRRAERAIHAERGAGERARLQDAIRKGRDVR